MRKLLTYLLAKTVQGWEIPTPIPNEAKNVYIDRASKHYIMAILHPNLIEREEALKQIWLSIRLNEARAKQKETKETQVNP
jgi:hypothetical protein